LEAGSNNKFMQNDLGVAVKLSEAFALKTGFQIRRNSKVANASVSKTDRLFTTNLVYSF
jgi:putative salt-induced outer membrane protein